MGFANERTVRDDRHVLSLARVEHDARSVCPGGQPNGFRRAAELQPADLASRESLGSRSINDDLAVNRIQKPVVGRWQFLFEDGVRPESNVNQRQGEVRVRGRVDRS